MSTLSRTLQNNSSNTGNSNLPKSEELFSKIIKNEFEKLRKEPDTLFENLTVSLDYEKEYQKFKKSKYYLTFLHESEYNKIRTLKSYFLGEIMIPIIEEVMLRTDDNIGFTDEILLENSYDILLKKLNPKLEPVLEKFDTLNETEQLQFIVENTRVLKQYGLIEEGPLRNFAEKLMVNNKNVFFRISRIIIKNIDLLLKSMGNFLQVLFGGFRDIATVVPFVSGFLTSMAQLNEDKKFLLRANLGDSPYLNDFMRSYGKISVGDIGKRCWEKSMALMTVKFDPEFDAKLLSYFYTLNGVNYSFKNPHDYDLEDSRNDYIFKKFLDTINTDKEFNKKVHYYRKCLYGNLIDYITGFLRVSIEMDGVEKSLLKNIRFLKDDGHQFVKTFREFYDFKPKNEAERIFINATIALLDLKGLALETLSNINKYRMQDIYLQEDMEFVVNKIRQAFNDIDQMSNDVLRDTKPVTGYKKYEENMRQNKEERTMIGNNDKKPKKLSLFD